MSPKESTTYRIDVDLLEAMREIKVNEGIPVTSQIEMAVRDWLKKRGSIKADRKRAQTRKRP